MKRKKVVQTELDAKEYKVLEEVVKRRGITIKQAVREAIEAWVRDNADLSGDPLFTLRPVKFKVRFECADHDRVLYGGGP